MSARIAQYSDYVYTLDNQVIGIDFPASRLTLEPTHPPA